MKITGTGINSRKDFMLDLADLFEKHGVVLEEASAEWTYFSFKDLSKDDYHFDNLEWPSLTAADLRKAAGKEE